MDAIVWQIRVARALPRSVSHREDDLREDITRTRSHSWECGENGQNCE